jgi:ATP-dependent helicase/nuclease subunit A
MKKKDKTYRDVLQEDLSYLNKNDQLKAQRANLIIENLLPMVDRIPVSEFIKDVIDALDYRAILATADLRQNEQDPVTTGGRLYRNLDKLLDDALASQQVSLRNFLDMVETLNEAGAREGEAPAEAEGAVRLMTIHKAKGLEFNFVVLAGASRGVRSTSEHAYFSKDLGITLKLDPPPMIYNLAKHMDKDQDKMEELRVLYVALTRAKQKLIISGYVKPTKTGLGLTNWSKDLVEAAELELPGYAINDGKPFDYNIPGGSTLRLWITDEEISLTRDVYQVGDEFIPQEPFLTPLYTPIIQERVELESEEEYRNITPQSWRVTKQIDKVQGNVLGSMVHKALEHWIFPDNPNIAPFLRTAALDAGIASEKQREFTTERTVELLNRLKNQPIWEKIDQAIERHHELPYSYENDGKIENRIIDLLYRDEQGWHIIDFKTDRIYSEAQKIELIIKYMPQIKQYKDAVKELVGIDADSFICFLDDQGSVSLVDA